MTAPLTDEHIATLRDCLRAAGYTVDGVAGRLGEAAHAALGRNETTPAWRATAAGAPVDTMVRLFLLQRPVPRALADKAFPGIAEVLAEAGLLVADGDEVRAAVDVRPYQDWWVVADLTPRLDGRREVMRPDYVLGISPASLNLIDLTVPVEVGSALDVGTGCGVQALHLAKQAARVVATDVNPRALELADLTARLNEVEVDLRSGSLFEPVVGERFDLIVSNPPFVVAPPSREKLTYREAGLAADALVELLVREAPARLTDGGWLQTLANWTHVRGQDWRERVCGWLGDRSAWAVQRETLGPEEYVELWLRDAGLHGTPSYPKRYDEWLSWLEEQRVEAIGMGWIALHNTGGSAVCEDWPYDVERPLGPHVLDRFRRIERAADDLDAVRLVVAADVQEVRTGPPGADHPESIVLRRQRGMRRAEQLDTALAGFVGACDGDLTAGQILDALAQLIGEDAAALRSRYAGRIRDLVVEGFLTPDD